MLLLLSSSAAASSSTASLSPQALPPQLPPCDPADDDAGGAAPAQPGAPTRLFFHSAAHRAFWSALTLPQAVCYLRNALCRQVSPLEALEAARRHCLLLQCSHPARTPSQRDVPRREDLQSSRNRQLDHHRPPNPSHGPELANPRVLQRLLKLTLGHILIAVQQQQQGESLRDPHICMQS